MAWVYYEVRLRDAAGRLPQTFGGQLCPLSATYPDSNRCTGATFGRSGTAFEATYTGLFGIGTGAELGTWKMTFDAVNRIETSLRLTVN